MEKISVTLISNRIRDFQKAQAELQSAISDMPASVHVPSWIGQLEEVENKLKELSADLQLLQAEPGSLFTREDLKELFAERKHWGNDHLNNDELINNWIKQRNETNDKK